MAGSSGYTGTVGTASTARTDDDLSRDLTLAREPADLSETSGDAAA
jgi:hypothetical protein